MYARTPEFANKPYAAFCEGIMYDVAVAMTPAILSFQALQLCNKVVVYRAKEDGGQFRTYAATVRIVAADGAETFQMELSHKNDELGRVTTDDPYIVERHGDRERDLWVFPCPGWSYEWLVPAHYYAAKIQSVRADGYRARIAQLERGNPAAGGAGGGLDRGTIEVIAAVVARSVAEAMGQPKLPAPVAPNV